MKHANAVKQRLAFNNYEFIDLLATAAAAACMLQVHAGGDQ